MRLPHCTPAHTRNNEIAASAVAPPTCPLLRTHPDYLSRRSLAAPLRDGAFLGPRIGDKIFVSLLVLTLYQGIGDELYPTNYINISAVLFMWCAPCYRCSAPSMRRF